jgi:hypothetical protein
MEVTIKFYTEKSWFNGGLQTRLQLVALLYDKLISMFSAPNHHRSIAKPITSGSLYFNPDNVDTV